MANEANKGERGMSQTKEGETGIEELRRAARASEMCRESALDGFSAEECLNMIRACWRSEWDILPDDLPIEEREFAARNARLSARAVRALKKRFGE